MNSLTLIVLAGVAIWAIKPLREFLVQRTNRTVKVLPVVFPLMFVGRVVYNFTQGKEDDLLSALLLVGVLLALWGGLVWLGNVMEKRRPTKVQAPDLEMISRIPGMPQVPRAVANPHVQQAVGALVSNPEVRRMAGNAAQTALREGTRVAAQIDTKDVAGSIGRVSGRWAARLRKNIASGSTSGSAPRP